MTAVRSGTLASIFSILAACGGGNDGAVRVTGLRVYEPLAEGRAAVAYMTIHNDTGSDVTITRVTSDPFAVADMHETRLEDGIAKMRALQSLEIQAGGQAVFEPGGKHIMLRSPATPPARGSPVTLRFHDGARLVLELETTLERRGSAAGSEQHR